MKNKLPGFALNERLISFAVRIENTSEKLPKTLAGKHLASQIIRSATSPALTKTIANNK